MKTIEDEATEAGWEFTKGVLTNSWNKDGERVWQASARRQWVRADYDGTRFSHHRSFDTFKDAINDKDGDKFGPSWRAEEEITRDDQTKEPCGVEAADVRAADRLIDG